MIPISEAIKRMLKLQINEIDIACKISPGVHSVSLATFIKHFQLNPDMLVADMIKVEFHCSCGVIL